MHVANIFTTEMINCDMVRQPVEMYLPFQILREPERFAFLKDDKKKGFSYYKYVDTGVGDPIYSHGNPIGLDKQIEAAEIIGADEITLDDKIEFDMAGMIPTNESFRLSWKAYNRFMKDFADKYPELNVGWVMQAESLEDWLMYIDFVVALPRIESILIPKWDCYTTMWGTKDDYRGRLELSRIIREKEANLQTKHHRIHWLGNGDGFREYLWLDSEDRNYLEAYDVTSTDSGLWIAELIQQGTCDIINRRAPGFEINLHEGKLSNKEVEELIVMQKMLLGSRRFGV